MQVQVPISIYLICRKGWEGCPPVGKVDRMSGKEAEDGKEAFVIS